MPLIRRPFLRANSLRIGFLLPRLACVLALGLAACDGGATGPNAVAQVQVGAAAEQLWQGTETQLLLLVRDAAGDRVEPAEVEWSSSDPAVLTVHPAEGDPLRAVARAVGAGTASVIARVGGVEGSLEVEVRFGGEIRIGYSGGRSGEFVAGGPVPTDRPLREVTHTRMLLQPANRDMLILFGLQVHADGTSDWFQMQLPRSSTRRTWDFGVNCGGTERCVDWVGLVFNATWAGNADQQTQYNAYEGSVTVTEWSATRIRAEFSGTFCQMYSLAPGTSSCDPIPGHELINVTGTIDLPLAP